MYPQNVWKIIEKNDWDIFAAEKMIETWIPVATDYDVFSKYLNQNIWKTAENDLRLESQLQQTMMYSQNIWKTAEKNDVETWLWCIHKLSKKIKISHTHTHPHRQRETCGILEGFEAESFSLKYNLTTSECKIHSVKVDDQYY